MPKGKKMSGPKKLPKKPPVLERAAQKVDVELFRFTYQVDFLVLRDGKPQQVMSSEPITVMSAEFDEHVMDIPKMKKMVEAQLKGKA